MKKILSNPVAISGLLAIPVLCFSWYISTRESVPLPSSDPLIQRNRSLTTGGIERPQSDLVQASYGQVSKLRRHEDDKDKKEQPLKIEFGHVTCPKVPQLVKGKNAQMDSVIEALETGKYPERLSPVMPPREFDRKAWLANPRVYRSISSSDADPQAKRSMPANRSKVRLVSTGATLDDSYLNTAEPGRIYDVMEPGQDVRVLTNVSDPLQVVVEGEAVYLSVRTEPLAPASFTAFDIGKFENDLMAITVLADEEGLAQTTFTGATGNLRVDIVAGSPMTSGTIRFQVSVTPAFNP